MIINSEENQPCQCCNLGARFYFGTTIVRAALSPNAPFASAAADAGDEVIHVNAVAVTVKITQI
jgi:hypothetical protein